MGTQDISRSIFDPEKHYRSVGQQQGRVLTDDDWNENNNIDEHYQRGLAFDVVGSAGSPNEGFRISDPVITDRGVDFKIAAGTFYLGGMRLTLENSESYLLQSDWLQGPELVEGSGPRNDLVVLEAYQQTVTAVEDSELFEVALGSADTTTRQKLMQRIHLLGDIDSAECEHAWAEFKQMLVEDGSWQSDNCLLPDAQLNVGFVDSGVGDDLCRPTAAGGYLGAENQAIRVQLVDESHLTWGFDNAAPLYRVEVDVDRRTLRLMTPPKDQMQWPSADQVVEILPWCAVLPNNQKLAEHSGHLTRVSTSYNPDTGAIEIADAIPEDGFDEWEQRLDSDELSENGRYYFLRVWNRGSDRESSESIEFSPNVPVALGNTGVEITLSGTQFNGGDYWVIAVRPETPKQAMPWILEAGRGPNGVKRYFSPLAILSWQADQSVSVTDCRPRFRPLTRQKICCSYVIGDGVSSFGDFNSIEEALDRLPQKGGELCLLPGIHRANVTILNKSGITIKGCGRRTKVIPREAEQSEALFSIYDSSHIKIHHLELIAFDTTAIAIVASEADAVSYINICDNSIFACESGLKNLDGNHLLIERNTIKMIDKRDAGVAVFSRGDDVLIRDNLIGVLPYQENIPGDDGGGSDNPNPSDNCLDLNLIYRNPTYLVQWINFAWSFDLVAYIPTNPYRALGGIQIGSGSERIEIIHNQIIGGAGNGITLGSEPIVDDFEAPNPRPPVNIDVQERSVTGFVQLNGEAVADEVVVLTQDDVVHQGVTSDQGYFSMVVNPLGQYTVTIADPSIAVESVEVIDAGEFGVYYQINVVDVDVDIDMNDVLAFIYQVNIDDNRIQSMGESGVGFPRLTADDIKEVLRLLVQQGGLNNAARMLLLLGMILFGAFTGLVMQLNIRNNLIVGCLRNLLDINEGELGKRFRGIGGISLPFCEEVVIAGNRIEDNGVVHRGPVQGIFIISTTHAEIYENHIVNNGATTVSSLQNPLVGGVLIFIAADFSRISGSKQGEINEKQRASMLATRGNSALQVIRFSDNVIQQPLGRSLTVVLSIGGMTIHDNQFITENSVAQDFDESVLSDTNSSIPNEQLVSALKQLSTSAGMLFINNLGNIGATKVHNNQATLMRPNDAGVSLAVYNTSNIQFSENHIQCGAGDLTSNVLLMSGCVDASHNRIEEVGQIIDNTQLPYSPLSMISLGIRLNTTVMNQSNHCVVAFGRPGFIVDEANLVLTDANKICPLLLSDYRESMVGYMAEHYYYSVNAEA
ncbi:DUF6519 domain-containing protein [Pleionea litopenaei]|uniref:DUF6519 domain-containing protein n=1 Tax=Pleionea litopenaei TaxID=3070815 RepID=A0AA51X746_9GAMM|nr:DUF6519 domain-containing protein [Pleionea sp. HL-JVS1]WMS87818.1 DUF6519 domain-containing protein [Pleionea sp. HL-JVS1]